MLVGRSGLHNEVLRMRYQQTFLVPTLAALSVVQQHLCVHHLSLREMPNLGPDPGLWHHKLQLHEIFR